MRKEKIFIGGAGYVISVEVVSGEIVWEKELKSGWLKSGNPFVTLLEAGDNLFAFAYGTLYRLDSETGAILWQTPIKKLKHAAGIISTGAMVSVSSEVALGGDSGGGDGGDGDGGGD